MTHWTSRVMLYWLLGVRDKVVEHEAPLSRSITKDDILIVPLLLHERPNRMGNSGDYFIQAHRQREIHNKSVVEDITGYDSEDYEDQANMYHLLKNYDEEWDETQELLEFYRETNRLIEMISWPNFYTIQFEEDQTGDRDTMGFIFDATYQDSRKEYFLPFYYALRDRCIRTSHYFYDENEPTIENIMSDDFTNMTDLYEVYDIHEHPLTGAATYKYIQKHLRQYMTQEDKSEVPCYYPGCDKPITLSQVKYIVKPEFYNDYKPPEPVHVQEELVANNAANAERRHRIRERSDRLLDELNAMADDEETVEQLQPIADILQQIGLIEDPEFNGVHDLDHYEAELDRIEQIMANFVRNNEHEEIFNGGRFNRSRKKQVRRKQKTLRNLLKKLK
jgi:hypothetical protein